MNSGVNSSLKAHFLPVLFFLFFSVLVSHPLVFNLDCFLIKGDATGIEYDGACTDTRTEVGVLLKNPVQHIINNRYNADILDLMYGALLMKILGLSNIQAHNLTFLSILWLSGVAVYFLAFRFTKHKAAALAAGVIYCGSSYIFGEFLWGHRNIMQIQWIPLIILFLERLMSKKSFLNTSCLGLLLGMQALASSQYTVYLSFMIPLYLLTRKPRLLVNRRFLLMLCISSLIGFIIIKPFTLETDSVTMTRSIRENLMPIVRTYSASLFLNPTTFFYLGPVTLTFTLVGVYYSWRRKIWWTLPFIVMLGAGLLLSIGPVHTLAPYMLLYKYWPLVKFYRTPYRIFPFILLSCSVLSSFFVKSLTYKKKKVTAGIILFIIFMALFVQTHQIEFITTHKILCNLVL